MFKIQWLVRFVTIVVFFLVAATTRDLIKTLIVTGLVLMFLHWSAMMYHLALRKKLKHSDLDEIDTMEGLIFERYLQELFKALGYKVKRTSDSGDYGADLILDDGDLRTVVQAKRYKGNVGIKAVQEILGAKAYYNADKAWVVTNSKYTNAALELAEKSGVQMYDRAGLKKLMETAGVNKPSEKVIKLSFKNQDNLNKVTCPNCSSPMVLRKGKHGVFYGCSDFPSCTGIKEAK